MLRSCYRTQMVFAPGGPPIWVRWYRTLPGADFLDTPTLFASRNWRPDRIEAWKDVGEVQGAPRQWVDGAKIGGAVADPRGCEDDALEEGLSLDPSTWPVLHDDGTPVCCIGIQDGLWWVGAGYFTTRLLLDMALHAIADLVIVGYGPVFPPTIISQANQADGWMLLASRLLGLSFDSFADFKVGLYTNTPAVANNLTLADLTEATFAGYARQPLAPFGPLVPDAFVGVSADGVTATEASSDPSPQDVNGAFIMIDGISGPRLAAVFYFDAPWTFNNGYFLQFVAQLSMAWS